MNPRDLAQVFQRLEQEFVLRSADYHDKFRIEVHRPLYLHEHWIKQGSHVELCRFKPGSIAAGTESVAIAFSHGAAFKQYCKLAKRAGRCMESLSERLRVRIGEKLDSLLKDWIGYVAPWTALVIESALESAPPDSSKNYWFVDPFRASAELIQGLGLSDIRQLLAGATITKRSTQQGEAKRKWIAALTAHHQYSSDSGLKWDPIGVNESARMADISYGAASKFFRVEFGGHVEYRRACIKKDNKLLNVLRLLNKELSGRQLMDTSNVDVVGSDDKEDNSDLGYARPNLLRSPARKGRVMRKTPRRDD
jgi:hypothetical protein